MAIFTSTTYPWITVNPSGGTGSAAGESVSIITAAHSGRSQRVGSVKFSGTTGTKAVTVTQEAHPLFISDLSVSDNTIDSSGQTITFQGVSNCPGLAFACNVNDGTIASGVTTIVQPIVGRSTSYTENDVTSIGDIKLDNVDYYQAQSFIWENEVGITSAYTFYVRYTIDRNASANARTVKLYAMGQSGTTSATCIVSTVQNVALTQSAGTFDVTPTELTPSYSGATSAVTVTSTSNWIVTEN